jgi:beta-galactosidase
MALKNGNIGVRPALYAASLFIAATAALAPGGLPYVHRNTNRIVIPMNDDWKFFPNDLADGESAALDESSFQDVCIPHTNHIVTHRNVDTGSIAGISWYRRHFTPLSAYAGRRFFLDFKGVSKVATVYVNGALAGEHKGAYTGFVFDITDKTLAGQDNVIAVRVDSRRRTDVPPEGGSLDYIVFGGIVRDVSLIITDPLRVEWVYLTTPTAEPGIALVNTLARVRNSGSALRNCTLAATLADADDNVAATGYAIHSLAAGDSFDFSVSMGPVSNPFLWHPDHPYLYTVYSRVKGDTGTVDEYVEKLGIRSVRFDKTDGKFYINGEWLKLRGLNRHETFPFIGRAAAKRLQEKDAEIIKYDMGANVVRCSHYPQSPAFLRRCDEIGLLVLEELPGWKYVGNAAWQALSLQSLDEMITRDRNHPSIISFGVRVNESADFHDFYLQTNQLARALDPSRPTHGVRIPGNGSTGEFLEDVWARNFDLPVATPNPMPWITPETVGHRCATHSWDGEQRLIDQLLQHAAVQDSSANNTHLAGVLGWCAFDYNSPYHTAENTVCYHGVADMYRVPKFAAYFFKSQTDPAIYGPMVYIADYWKSDSPDAIYAVSNCGSVELFVNGVSRGVRKPEFYTSLPHPIFRWTGVPFESGRLSAIGYIGGKEAARHVRMTPGVPVKLAIVPDTTVLLDGGDMTRVAVAALDQNDQIVPCFNDSVTLSVAGAGIFLGESPIALEDGKTAFFVQTRSHLRGTITCQASSNKIASATAFIQVMQSTPVRLTAQLAKPGISSNKPALFFKMLAGNRVSLPSWAVAASSISVYGMDGRLLYKKNNRDPFVEINGKYRKNHCVYLAKLDYSVGR